MVDKQQLAAMGEHMREVEDCKPEFNVPEGWKLVPVEPTGEQWGGLARDIVFWMRSYQSNQHVPRTMVEFITSCGHATPEWMAGESELLAKDHVISKGTIAALIYKAMLAAAPEYKP